MPKASSKPKTKPKSKQTTFPYTKSTSSTPPSASTSTTKSKSRPKTGTDSHLYTDDNPSTTLHGTGFKDAITAHHTLEIISQKSLTYQWQVVNTMYYRAKHHPARKKYEERKRSGAETRDGEGEGRKFDDAMQIFEEWLEGTYKDAKRKRQEEGREFNPLISKPCVKRYLDRIRKIKDFEMGVRFAEIYVDLPKGKRLANILVEEGRPKGRDWEVQRLIELDRLVDEREERGEQKEEGLWDEDKGGVSEWHLKYVTWAWTPLSERRLPA
jgi:hypothetical protein